MMENIIQKIIDIDQRAQQKYIDAQQHREDVEAEVEEEIRKMNAETQENGQAKLAKLLNSENEQLNEAHARITADLAQKKQRLDQIYQEKHLDWEQALFEQILQK